MLTDSSAKAAKSREVAYRLSDSQGLYLDVRPSGQKIWRYRFRLSGRESIFTIGEYPAVSLSAARTARANARSLVKAGKNPTSERKLTSMLEKNESALLFGTVLDEWLSTRSWGVSTRINRENQINLHIRPYLDQLPLREISAMMVLGVLRNAEKPGVSKKTGARGKSERKTGGAGVPRRLRQYVSGVFDLAIITGRADSNPAGPLRGALTEARKTEHKTPLTPPQIGEVLRAIDGYRGHFQTITALRLLWWTIARPGEVAGARWDEMDLDSGTWTIPGERMKAGLTHIVPLPQQAVAALCGLAALTCMFEFVLPHRDDRARHMNVDSLAAAADRFRINFAYSPHATRTTASTVLNENGYRYDVIEKQLAHVEKDQTRRAYNRAEYLEERRVMMQNWSDYLDQLKAGAGTARLRISSENS